MELLFPGLSNSIAAAQKAIKEEGEGDTTHYPEIPIDVFEAIMDLLAILLKILIAHRDKDISVYQAALENLVKIVPAYKDKWNHLVGLGIQFLITLFDIRRGREGIVYLTKDHYRKVEEEGIIYWKKVNIIA